jgi:uncharacterized phage-associated protein
VFWQLQRSTDAQKKTHDWNRRKATQDACDDFLDPKLFALWQRIYDPVVQSGKLYGQLNKEEQQAVHTLLSFLESMAILIRHDVVDEKIVFDHFGTVWPPLYHCSKEFISETVGKRNDDRVFEHFVANAERFKQMTVELERRKRHAGKVKPRPKLT